MEKFNFFNKFKDAVMVVNRQGEVIYTNSAFKRYFWDYKDFKRFSHKLSYDFCPLDAENRMAFLPANQAISTEEDFSALVNYQDSKGEYSYYSLSSYKRSKYVVMVFSNVSAEIELDKIKTERDLFEKKYGSALEEVENLKRTAQLNQAQAVKMTLINKISNIIRESIDSSKILNSALKELATMFGAYKAYYASYNEEEFKIEHAYGKNKKDFINKKITYDKKVLKNISDKKTDSSVVLKEFDGSELFDVPMMRVILPIYHTNNILGIIVLISYQKRDMTEEIEVLESVSAQIGNAIAQAKLYEDNVRTLTELRETQLQLVNSEKMASLGQLVAGIAHEINTPFASIKSNNAIMTKLISKMSDEDLKEMFLEINSIDNEAVQRVHHLVTSLKKFVRLDEAELQEADINKELDLTLTLLHHETKNRIEVIKNYGKLPYIKCYPNMLNQVFMNILQNACQAIEGKGQIIISTIVENNNLTVKIKDSGKGIKQEYIDKIFNTGFTTKPAGLGSGWGLAISSQIIKKHNGKIHVQSEFGHGSEFSIVIPIA